MSIADFDPTEGVDKRTPAILFPRDPPVYSGDVFISKYAADGSYLWTRTMGDTAQVNSFQVTTDLGETYGPFTVDSATVIYRFDTQFTAKRLRFELLDTSGGNTGALEIEVYGEAVP